MDAARVLARGLARAGLPALAWRLRRVGRRGGRGLILMYHRVSDEADLLDLCVPPATFDRQLAMLKRRVRVVALRELVERLAAAEPLPEDLAAITFDDGYRDNLEIALPILQRHGLPATVFVTSGFVDGTARPRAERLEDALRVLWRRHADAGAWRATVAATDDLTRATLARPASTAALLRLEHALKGLAWEDGERVLGELERLAGDRTSSPTAMLDWPAVRALASQGIEIGSHTVSHVILARAPLDHAERELRDSKARLEAEIGRPVVGFAYPNGNAGDFTAEHVALVRRAGYGYACTAERGANAPGDDAFRLRRIGIGRDSRALLDLKLALANPTQRCAA
jgi:peptidoglycan/xylan/chitin deacetylase (PgdA/CDA1 family)